MRQRRPARTECARRFSRLRSWRLLIHLLFAASPFLVAQDELLDLARRGLGQLGKFDGRWGLEAGDVLLAEVYDLLLGRLLPCLSTTNALGRSPHFSSGMATTAASITAGWRDTACSTSMVEMFSPPEMMMTLFLSRISM